MKKRKNEFGLSMVELMIAVLILIVGVISIVNMFIGGSMNIVTIENANQAINLCREKLEEIKMRQSQYDTLATETVPFATVGTTTIGACNATWTITIEGIDDATQGTTTPAQGDYLRVTVSVVWMENTLHKRRLFTYIGDIQ
jgi:Tfp pilus assembly protein PilV